MSTAARVEGHAPTSAPPPDLSIIVLTYNRASMLHDCLDSLVHQTYPAERLEIVVADDGSTDATTAVVAAVARDHAHVRHVRHPHRGIPATRNLGLRHARGALVAIVADDYILDPAYAETLVTFFREHPQADVIRFDIVAASHDFGSRVSHAYYRASVRRRLAETPGDPGRHRSVQRAFPRDLTTEHGLDASGAAGFRQGVFDRVGRFDESLARAEDSDLTVRLRRHGIPIYFDPNHPVRHQYDPYLRDTLVKSWLTGWYRYHHWRRHHEATPAIATARRLFASKAAALAAEWQASRRDGETAWFLAALPFALIFEITNKAGFVCSWLCDRWGRKPASPPG